VMFGALFLISAFLPPHPIQAFGPPGPTTPEVKPDWYLMWVYGFLKIVPSEATFSIFGATIGPNFLGGLLFPALLFGVLTLVPWIDRTNQRVFRRVEYQEPVRQSPFRLSSGVAALTFIGTLFIAAYYDTLGLNLIEIWAIVVGLPVLAGAVTWAATTGTEPEVRFDPHASPVPVDGRHSAEIETH
jgi:cytochrome b-561